MSEPEYEKVKRWLNIRGILSEEWEKFMIHQEAGRTDIEIPPQDELDVLNQYGDATFSFNLKDLNVYLDDVKEPCLSCFNKVRDTNYVMDCDRHNVNCTIFEVFVWRRWPREFIQKYWNWIMFTFYEQSDICMRR